VHQRAVALEQRCRHAWHVEAAGGGVPLRPDQYEELSKVFDFVPFPGMWEAMCRRELRRDPGVLEE
jgi:L-fuculose-phosphate aldolase